MNVSESYKKYFKEDSPNMTSRFTYMALMRATVAKLFKQYDKMLVLDCDIIVNENIDELKKHVKDKKEKGEEQSIFVSISFILII